MSVARVWDDPRQVLWRWRPACCLEGHHVHLAGAWPSQHLLQGLILLEKRGSMQMRKKTEQHLWKEGNKGSNVVY